VDSERPPIDINEFYAVLLESMKPFLVSAAIELAVVAYGKPKLLYSRFAKYFLPRSVKLMILYNTLELSIPIVVYSRNLLESDASPFHAEQPSVFVKEIDVDSVYRCLQASAERFMTNKIWIPEQVVETRIDEIIDQVPRKLIEREKLIRSGPKFKVWGYRAFCFAVSKEHVELSENERWNQLRYASLYETLLSALMARTEDNIARLTELAR
jgi:hypothetical protein